MISQLEEIKSKLDIVEIVGQYVKLQKAGANYKALCPFHREKTPSFVVSPSRQIFHCFGCGIGGDIFTFLMKIDSLEFSEAVKVLADKAGVKLVYESPEINSQKQTLVEINTKAQAFFENQLENNQEALLYLGKRGLKKETIKEFGLGFAQDDWRALVDFLTQEGFKPEDLARSGLAINRRETTEITHQTESRIQKTDLYDRFRSRLMFPIEDSNGRIVGFTGRIMQGKTPLKTIKDIEAVGKYVNSPQTLVFDKSKILYGLSKTKNHLRQLEATLLVEGQMDFLMGWQAGIKNIAATSGTSLTPYHLTILKKYNNTLILGFDMDEAGERAAEKSIDLALAKEFNVKILQLPQSKDLADYLLEKKDAPEAKNLLAQAIPIMDFYFRRAQTTGNIDNLESKKALISYFLPRVKKLVNPLDKAFWLEKTSQYVKIDIKALEDELKRISLEPERQEAADENEPGYQYAGSGILANLSGKPRSQIIGERIMAFLIKDFTLKDEVAKNQKYFPEEMREVLNAILSAKLPENLEPEHLRKINLKAETIDKINELALRADYELEMLEKFNVALEEEIKKQLMNLKQVAVKDKQKKLENEIALAEKNKDEKQKQNLIQQFDKLSKELLQ